jgi:hypothetical protein
MGGHVLAECSLDLPGVVFAEAFAEVEIRTPSEPQLGLLRVAPGWEHESHHDEFRDVAHSGFRYEFLPDKVKNRQADIRD